MRWIVLIGVLLGGCSTDPQWIECDLAAGDCSPDHACMSVSHLPGEGAGRGYCTRACAEVDVDGSIYEQGCEGIGLPENPALCSPFGASRRACLIRCDTASECPDGLRCVVLEGYPFGHCEP